MSHVSQHDGMPLGCVRAHRCASVPEHVHRQHIRTGHHRAAPCFTHTAVCGEQFTAGPWQCLRSSAFGCTALSCTRSEPKIRRSAVFNKAGEA